MKRRLDLIEPRSLLAAHTENQSDDHIHSRANVEFTKKVVTSKYKTNLQAADELWMSGRSGNIHDPEPSHET